MRVLHGRRRAYWSDYTVNFALQSPQKKKENSHALNIELTRRGGWRGVEDSECLSGQVMEAVRNCDITAVSGSSIIIIFFLWCSGANNERKRKIWMREGKEKMKCSCPAVCKFIHLDANNTISMALMKTIFINEWNQQTKKFERHSTSRIKFGCMRK